MSKPGKKRQHSKQRKAYAKDKYENHFKCRSCPFEIRSQYPPFQCPHCQGHLIKLTK